jgi:hypothetical protein
MQVAGLLPVGAVIPAKMAVYCSLLQSIAVFGRGFGFGETAIGTEFAPRTAIKLATEFGCNLAVFL